MEKIKSEINSASQRTEDAIKSIKKASERIESHFHIINNIYTDRNSIDLDKLNEDIRNKIKEIELLKDVVKQWVKITDVKDAQIKLLLDTLSEKQEQINRLKNA